eukprot:CAMPEP_0175886294 /NCGR_PEP_ID=MMETSP0107_2-20121207/45553_1 /TAXON_ID=195067 ORGANISM="Goniomonas pacifica, Strain CCMP1869" /NCGR_SAMPLE_ID=MMETSP0107_2 /ASSEMBLY_ACC=CAM_ASM_000203 /LENGTH=105 /DNA_ID=CAMNT_0017206653 /DNA_START=78 /DNA_END=393 /DNA_ORIENTATION=-
MTSRDSRWAGARFSSSSGKKPRGAREEGITFELLLSLNPTLIPAEIGEDPELKARCFSQLSCKLAGDVQGVRSAFGPHMNSSFQYIPPVLPQLSIREVIAVDDAV